jgi:hypothetical protein
LLVRLVVEKSLSDLARILLLQRAQHLFASVLWKATELDQAA